jgi:P-type Cu+ transporter
MKTHHHLGPEQARSEQACPEQAALHDCCVAVPPELALPVPAPLAAGTVYTCPMHPQIRQNHAGACPLCGMALEPLLPSAEEAENPELLDFKRRLLWAAKAGSKWC